MVYICPILTYETVLILIFNDSCKLIWPTCMVSYHWFPSISYISIYQIDYVILVHKNWYFNEFAVISTWPEIIFLSSTFQPIQPFKITYNETFYGQPNDKLTSLYLYHPFKKYRLFGSQIFILKKWYHCISSLTLQLTNR